MRAILINFLPLSINFPIQQCAPRQQHNHPKARSKGLNAESAQPAKLLDP
jgi:hypothetical protein